MKRFIALTFALLGWTFWELSDGSEFEPETRLTAEAAQTTEGEQLVARADTSGDAPMIDPNRSLSNPEQVVLASVSTEQTAPAKAEPVVQPATQLAALTVSEGSAASGVVADQAALVDAVKLSTLVLHSNEPEAQPAEIVDSPLVLDLRQVTGNRVNFREGPGTDFGILAKLRKNTEVEVLSDNGDGWLELRVVESDQVGWLADWLVTAQAN